MKLLIIQLLVSDSWGYDGNTETFCSDGWKLKVPKKQFNELCKIAENLSAVTL